MEYFIVLDPSEKLRLTGTLPAKIRAKLAKTDPIPGVVPPLLSSQQFPLYIFLREAKLMLELYLF